MASYDAEVNKYVVSTFGSDVSNLVKVKKLYHNVLKKKEDLERKLSVATNDAPTKIEGAIALARSSLKRSEELQIEQNKISQEIAECLERSAGDVNVLKQSVNNLHEIERCISYFKWIIKIEDSSGGIQQSILSDSIYEACRSFKILTNYSSNFLKHGTKCHNLTSFLKQTIDFWYKILKDKLNRDLDEVLRQISWPFISAPGPDTLVAPVVAEKSAPSPYTVPDPSAQLEKVVGCLLLIDLPEHLREENTSLQKASVGKPDASENGESSACSQSNKDNTSTSSADPAEEEEEDYIMLPFQLLLRPLVKRFRYHFTGNKATNILSKPEWYLTQVLNWIGNHAGFLEHTMQPILDKYKFGHVDALVMFTQGLLRLVNDKLSVDIEEIVYTDEWFSHTVDEVLLFDRELRASFDIPDVLLRRLSPINFLTQLVCLTKWLYIEKTCATERLDALLSSDEAWKSKYDDDVDADDMKTPCCAESFITLLQTITDRYKNLPSSVQLQFLDLQLYLLEDFRIRLTQLIRSDDRVPLDDVTFSILNAALYVSLVLQEWANMMFFLQLKYHKDKLDAAHTDKPVVPDTLLDLALIGSAAESSTAARDTSTDDTVFETTINLYERICSEGVNDLIQLLMSEFKSKCEAYANDQWLTLPTKDEQVTMLVSRSACPMLEVLQSRMCSFEQKLCRTLFSRLWRQVAEFVDAHLFKKVVLENHFNAGGASQLHFDMTRNLFPLFGGYTSKPDNYYKRMKESCILLNLPLGSALLLLEEFEEARKSVTLNEPSAKKLHISGVLSELGVFLVKPVDAELILKRRIDWTAT